VVEVENEGQNSGNDADLDSDIESTEELFSGESTEVPIPASPSPDTALPKLDIEKGPLVWEKSDLPASDVERQTGHGTGGIRLVQADFKVDGDLIDWTQYFRYDVFGDLNWRDANTDKFRAADEISEAKFIVSIMGEDYGYKKLTISHKPSGEANQGNYTTQLHWGEMRGVIHDLNLIGCTFRLYSPPADQEEPYHIEIECPAR
jgi:hypothetical protein